MMVPKLLPVLRGRTKLFTLHEKNILTRRSVNKSCVEFFNQVNRRL